MKVISKGEIFHRTRLMEAAQADRFARCLSANSLFALVSVEEWPTAKGAARFYVRYQPTSGRRQGDLIRAEVETRERRAQEQAGQYAFVRDDTGRFFHCLNTATGEVHETTEQGCTCGDFTYRGAAVGFCKHVRILRGDRAAIQGWAQAAAIRPTAAQMARDFPEF